MAYSCLLCYHPCMLFWAICVSFHCIISVWQIMRGKKKADLKKLMSVSDNIADLNVERFKNFLTSAKVSEERSAAEMAVDIARPAVSATLQRLKYIFPVVQFLFTPYRHSPTLSQRIAYPSGFCYPRHIYNLQRFNRFWLSSGIGLRWPGVPRHGRREVFRRGLGFWCGVRAAIVRVVRCVAPGRLDPALSPGDGFQVSACVVLKLSLPKRYIPSLMYFQCA